MPRTFRNHGLLQVLLLFNLVLYAQADALCAREYRPWGNNKEVKVFCPDAQNNSISEPSFFFNPEFETIQADEISMEVINKQNGTIRVEFPLIYGAAIFYDVLLFVNETATSSQMCQGFDEDDNSMNCDSYFHSVQRLSLSPTCENAEQTQGNCSQTCDTMASVVFNKVYTGCYKASVVPYIDVKMFDMPVYSAAYMLETQYKKEPVWMMKPSIGEQINYPHPGSEDFVVKVVITDLRMLFEERLLIKLQLWNCSLDYNYGDGYKEIAGWTVALSEEDELIWKSLTNSSFLEKCWEENENVNCKFTNMTTGNYCLELTPDCPYQCEHSVWTYNGVDYDSCDYWRTFEVSSNSPGHTPRTKVPYETGTILIAALIVLLAIAVVAAICGFLYCRLCKPPPPWDPLDKEELQPSCTTPFQSQVMLLYAQDCEEFMSLMATFREVLREAGNCEVLDCFDTDRIDIASCPSYWMRYWVSRSDVKVIVVASPCAMVHQQEGRKFNLRYNSPLNYCGLFRLGLQEVQNNEQRNYRNTFVVRVDHSDLDYLLPYARYKIPVDVEKLLEALNFCRLSNGDNNLSTSFITKKLESEHSKLLDHHRKQPNYTSDILVRLTEDV